MVTLWIMIDMRLNMKIQSLFKINLFLIILGIILPINKTHGEITCTGEACNLLPPQILFQLNQLDNNIKAQYFDNVLLTLIETSIVTNINSSMMGPGIVNRFQVGGSITASGQKKKDIDIITPEITIRKLPNVGASVAPNFNFAFNLGWILGYGPSDTVPEYSSFLHRFNIYLHGFQYNFANADIQDIIRRQDDKIRLNGDISNYGFTVRFHLVPNYSDGIGLFEYSGISLGLGFHYLRQRINLLYEDPGTQPIRLGPTIGTWGGFPNLNFETNVSSIPLDIRTGFRMFYFLTLFAGVGTSMNFGSAKLTFQKEGPLTLRFEDSLVTGTLPPQLQILAANLAGAEQSGILSMNIRGNANAPNSLSFILGGVELNLGMLKILVEGMASRNIQSINLGAKIAF